MQSRGNVGPWSDLYALGGTLEKAIAGQAPPKAMDRMRSDPRLRLAARRDLHEAYTPAFFSTIDKALEVEESERWQDAAEWMEGLRMKSTVERSTSVSHPPVSAQTSDSFRAPATSSPKFATSPERKSNPVKWIVAACLVLGLLALTKTISGNKTQNRTVKIGDDSAVQREQEETEAAATLAREAEAKAANAERDRQAMEARPQVEAEIAKQKSEERALQDLSKQRLEDQNKKQVIGSKAGEERNFEIAPGMSMGFCWVPPGEFTMGSPVTEQGRDKDETQHRVKISRGFWMAKTETTQVQWSAIRERNPSHFWSKEQPVERVSWNDLCGNETRDGGFLGQVNAHAPSGWRFGLPMEAEWEYDCQAGSSQSMTRSTDLSEMGWYAANSENRTHPVAGKKANAWGLYDMHGNVWEWCADWYGAYPSNTLSDPGGNPAGSERVIRGGGWFFHTNRCRAASRSKCRADYRDDNLGFRLVLRPESRVQPEISKSSGPDDGLIFVDDFARSGNSIDPNLKSNRCFSFKGGKTYDIVLKDRLLPTKSGVVLRFKWHAPKPNLIGSSSEGTVMLQFDVYNPNGNRIMYQPKVLSSSEWQEISLRIQVGFDAERILVWNKWEDVEMYIDDLKIASFPQERNESLESKRADKVDSGDPFAFLQNRVIATTEASNWEFDRIRFAINY